MSETLLTLTPDPARGAKTLARCHGKLAVRRRRSEARNRRSYRRILTTERLLLTGLCVVYLISMAGNILRGVGAP